MLSEYGWLQNFAEGAKEIRDKMEKVACGELAPPGSIKDYCPWMAEFQAPDHDQDLEIPGKPCSRLAISSESLCLIAHCILKV